MSVLFYDDYTLFVEGVTATLVKTPGPVVHFIKHPTTGWTTKFADWSALPPSLRIFITIQLGLIYLTVTNGTQSNNNLHGVEIPDGQPVQVVQL